MHHNGIPYEKYYTHRSAVESTFKNLCKGKYESFDPINMFEHHLMNKCFNGGLQQLNDKYKDKVVDSFGYDFISNYPTILQSDDFMIPTSAPEESILKVLPDVIKLGIYRVKIISSHPQIKHVFSFSKDHHYTDISLKFAIKHKVQFDINIELIQDNTPNAYIYQNHVSGKSIFKDWYEKLSLMKYRNKGNLIVKNLLSSIWGSITHMKELNKTYEEIEKENIKVGEDYDIHELVMKTDREYYKLIPMKNPYTFNIRIKPFLTGYARNLIANVILDNLDSFIRVHTDGACFTNKINTCKYRTLQAEIKTTGKIKWYRVNKYSISSYVSF